MVNINASFKIRRKDKSSECQIAAETETNYDFFAIFHL